MARSAGRRYAARMSRRVVVLGLLASALSAEAAPQLAIDVSAAGRTVPHELFGINLPARAEATPRIQTLFRQLGLTLYRFPGGDSPGWRWMTGSFDFAAGDAACTLNKPAPLLDFVGGAGGQVLFSVNLESAPASEAAALATSVRGQGVRYWELGNEVFGDWDRGYRSAAQYASDIGTYGRAIKAADPAARIGADMAGAYGDTDTTSDGVDTANWDQVVLSGGGATLDFLSYHWYPGRLAQEDPMHVMAGSLKIASDVARFDRLSTAALGHALPVGYLEWDGVFDTDTTGMRHTLANAILYADALGQMATAGVALANAYESSTRSYGLVVGYDACAGTAWDGRSVRPKAYALELASRLGGGRLLPALVSGGHSYDATTTHPLQEYAGAVPYLSAYAVRTSQGLAVLVISREPTAATDLDVQVSGAAAGHSAATVSVLTGPSLTASNESSAGTVGITTSALTVALPAFTLSVAARSVTLLEIPLAPGDGGALPGGDGGGADAAAAAGGGGSGCGCRTSGAAGGPPALLFAVLLLAFRRRRAA